MANQLISVSSLDAARQPAPQQEKVMVDDVAERWFLYRSDCPKGEIFEGQEAIDAALKDGWVDSPVGLGETPEPAPESPEESEPELEGDEDASE